MRTRKHAAASLADPAAILAAAVSLWAEVQKREKNERLNLSEAYNGVDQCMREAMRIATLFEMWSGERVVFEELEEPWPYLIEERFGRACLAVIGPLGLALGDERACESIARQLGLTIREMRPEGRGVRGRTRRRRRGGR